jgi:hypothetical protein
MKNLIKKRIYNIVCKIFVSNEAYLQLKFVKLSFANIMLLKQSAQLPILKAVISQMNSVFLQKFTQTFYVQSKNKQL